MTVAMTYVAAALLVVVNVAWLFLTLLGLPGNWLMIATAALAEWALEPQLFARNTFIAVIAIAVLGELIELFAGAIGSKRGGASALGSLGALVGGILGAILGTGLIPIPVIGTILGAALGAFAGSALLERARGRSPEDAARAGRGAAIGHVMGNITKFALGCTIWVTLAVAAFTP